MDDARLRQRIQVIVVTTRAAAHSLPPGNGQIPAAVQRGISLLDAMVEEVDGMGSAATREQLDQARRELRSLLDEGSA